MYPEFAVRQQVINGAHGDHDTFEKFEGFEGFSGSDVYGTREKRKVGFGYSFLM